MPRRTRNRPTGSLAMTHNTVASRHRRAAERMVAGKRARAAARAAAAEEAERAALAHAAEHNALTPVQRYRLEKARNAQQTAERIADARAELDRQMALRSVEHRGGRPKRIKPLTVTRDPANALIEALEGRR